MIYDSKKSRKDYSCPLLGNGDMALNPNCEGGVLTDEKTVQKNFAIYRAGRRQPYNQNPPAKLLPWGEISFDCGAEITHFTQELNEQEGYVSSLCTYKDGLIIKTDCFVHHEYNIYAVKKIFKGTPAKVSFELTFGTELTDNLFSLSFTKAENTAFTDADVRAYDSFKARIALTASKNAEITETENGALFDFDIKDGDELCFYYCLEDSLYVDDHIQAIERMLDKIKKQGFDGMLSESVKIREKYHAEGYVKTGNELIDSAYRTALYNLKCYTTRWSIPIGISNSSWFGKYFAFDEFYSFHGLLTSNRCELAKRVPKFRSKICLPKAIFRTTVESYETKPEAVQARFMWETGERGEELCPFGFWQDHIFHMAAVTLGAFEYYEYTADKSFLRECYPMIKACAQFYTLNCIVEGPENKLYVSKCTDLERLGSSIFNPFFTSCGVIKTLEILAKSAEILNIDGEYGKYCRDTAEKLRKTLPNDGEKYIPYSGCKQKSIAVFTGKFPFDVIANDDTKFLPALTDFEKNGHAYGNMYAVGNGISPWYACWKAVTYARLNMADEAYSTFIQSLDSLGAFSEMFEINEKNVTMRPWFTTASGMYLSALNEMLLQSDGENIYLLPAAPKELSDVSFKLLAKCGAVVEAVIRNRKIEKLNISFLPSAEKKEFNVYLDGKKQLT